MADPTARWHDSVPGRFYVDTACILCSVCTDAAPDHFRLSDDEDHDVCFRQPRDPDELGRCLEAMANCPVEAIGDDGDTV